MQKATSVKSPDQSRLALILKVLASAYLIYLGIYFGLGGLALLVQIFDMSIAVGLVLVLLGGIGIGMAFLGCTVALTSLGLWSAFEDVSNPYEYYAKLIGSYIGAVILAYVAYLVGSLLLATLSGWLASFI